MVSCMACRRLLYRAVYSVVKWHIISTAERIDTDFRLVNPPQRKREEMPYLVLGV